MLTRTLARFARRCHLTEQIGARRRELYASDTWFPLDSEISWNYRKQDTNAAPSVSESPAERSKARADRSRDSRKSFRHAGEAVSEPRRSETRGNDFPSTSKPDGAVVSENSSSRLIEVYAAEVTRSGSTDSRSRLDSMWQLADDFPTEMPVFKVESFLEQYLCLFDRMSLSDSLAALSSSQATSSLRANTNRLLAHYETLTCPSPSDFLELESLISRIDKKVIPSSVFAHLTKIKLFLKHPIVRSLMSVKEDWVLAPTNPAWPSKASIKKMTIPPGPVREVIIQDLKSKILSTSVIYRLSVLKPYVTCKHSREVIDGILPGEMKKIELHAVNESFRLSLFPTG